MDKIKEELEKDKMLGQTYVDTENKLTCDQKVEINALLAKQFL